MGLARLLHVGGSRPPSQPQPPRIQVRFTWTELEQGWQGCRAWGSLLPSLLCPSGLDWSGDSAGLVWLPLLLLSEQFPPFFPLSSLSSRPLRPPSSHAAHSSMSCLLLTPLPRALSLLTPSFSPPVRGPVTSPGSLLGRVGCPGPPRRSREGQGARPAPRPPPGPGGDGPGLRPPPVSRTAGFPGQEQRFIAS